MKKAATIASAAAMAGVAMLYHVGDDLLRGVKGLFHVAFHEKTFIPKVNPEEWKAIKPEVPHVKPGGSTSNAASPKLPTGWEASPTKPALESSASKLPKAMNVAAEWTHLVRSPITDADLKKAWGMRGLEALANSRDRFVAMPVVTKDLDQGMEG